MRLRRLDIRQLPGIDRPFAVEFEGAGIQVVVGPNGIGKSSLCRAAEALYWPDRGPAARISVTGRFEIDGAVWQAEREGPELRWSVDGETRTAPALPPSRYHDCFFLRLRSLLHPSAEQTGGMAREIHRQMWGGVDLQQVATGLQWQEQPRRGLRERKEFDEARQQLRAAESEQQQLQQQADRRRELRDALAAAEAAARRAPAVDRAISLAKRVGEHAALAAELAAFPAALARLSGEEGQRAAELTERIERNRERIAAADTALAAAREAAAAADLTQELPEAELAALVERARALGRLEPEVGRAGEEARAARAELAAARAALGGHPGDTAGLDLADHAAWFRFLRDAGAARLRRETLRERLRLLADGEAPAAAERCERLAEAAGFLRAWLRAPAPDGWRDRLRRRRRWALAALLSAAAALLPALLLSPWFALLAAALLGFLAAIPLLPGSSAAAAAGRAEAERGLAGLAVDPPAAWEVAGVEARLRDLEREWAGLEAGRQRARDREAERQRLESELAARAPQEAELAAEREALRARLGVGDERLDSDLVDLARALDGLRMARGRSEAADAQLAARRERRDAMLADLAESLERHGEPRPGDAAAAEAGAAHLRERHRRRQEALARETAALRQRREAVAEREAGEHALWGIYAGAGLEAGDAAGLAALLDSLPAYRQLAERVARLDHQNTLDRDELERVGEASLAAMSRAELMTVQATVAAAGEEAAALREEIAAISARVDAAREAHALRDRIAACEQQRQLLAGRREVDLTAAAGRFLLAAVEREYEQTQMPRVLDRARGHFFAFARHSHQLRLRREDGTPRLVAMDVASRQQRELDELSDGTRVQLLLATRLAFAEEVEQGRILPLFLDEALDHSDPERFEAIAGSLGRIAVDPARQILVLTSDPLDVERLRRGLAADDRLDALAAPVDLGRLRRAAATPAADLLLPPPAVIPHPAGLSVAAYGRLLSVPAFAPAAGASAQHLLYLLPDDLVSLHSLLAAGIATAGQWRQVAGTALAEQLCAGATTPAVLSGRVDLLQPFCALHRIGRGRPVGRDELRESGAISDHYFDPIVALAAELGGDAVRLLAALRDRADPRLRGFRSGKVEQLEEFLRDEGCLDDRPVLEEAALRLRLLAEPSAAVLGAEAVAACLHGWWHWAEGEGTRGEGTRGEGSKVTG